MTSRGVAVVTAATAGVGCGVARQLAQRGFDVAAIPVDVSDFHSVDEAAARTEAALGPIDIWVNDAMTTVFAPSWKVDPADFKRAVEVTFFGQVWGTQAALARMRPRDRGTVVNVGSALAFLAIPLQGPYCAAKSACRGFSDSVRAELVH